jgi:nucleoside-diphosphate-sugar epimerase
VRVVVTGGSGKAGRAVVRDLLEHGHAVRNVDVVRSDAFETEQLVADVTDYGETVEALREAEAVVHLAAIPAPGLKPDELTFRTNITSTYNVFSAAALHGMRRVVWASSETILGLPFDRVQPEYAPIDEAHVFPETSYSLSKLAGETLAEQFARWTGVAHLGLRFSNVMEPQEYERFTSWQDDPAVRKWNLWGYVDARDVAQACRLALDAPVEGAEAFNIAAADTAMERPSAELMAEVYPHVPLTQEVAGTATLISIEKARRLLGYAPAYSWRNA